MIALLAFVLLAQEKQYLADTDPKCIKCHEEKRDDWKDSIHALRKVGCIDCHGEDDVDPKKKNGVHLKTGCFRKMQGRTVDGDKRNESPAFCGKCHQEELKEFKRSDHFGDWESAGKVKGCLSCHEYHKTSPANRRAILEHKDLGCAKCHKPETKQIGVMKKFVEHMGDLDRELAKLEDIFKEKIPGISWTEEMATRDSHAEVVRTFRTRQHFANYAEFKVLDVEIPAATAKVTPDVQKAEQRKHGFARFKVYALAAFLGVMAINLLVVRAWCLRRFGAHRGAEEDGETQRRGPATAG